MYHEQIVARRALLALLGAGAVALPLGQAARAAGVLSGLGQGTGLGSGLTGLLGKASDSALTKLAVPGAFYGDTAVRIALPVLGSLGGLGGALGGLAGGGSGAGGLLGKALSSGASSGLTDGLVRKLNDAAGLAANTAKPVFHTAISKLSLTDVPGIVGKSDGATQYLRSSAGDQLKLQVRPLIDTALGHVGAFAALDKLTKSGQMAQLVGLGRDKLGASVTDQALNGIFKYIGAEEAKLRANPLAPVGSLLGGLIKTGN